MDSGFRILLVDDETTFLESTAELLRREGMDCDSAASVEAAQKMLAEGGYDLLITDIKMHGNDNLEFVRQLAEQDWAIPIILVTGHPSIASAADSVELPVVAYLLKPFEFADLLTRVRTVQQNALVQKAVRDEMVRLQEYRGGLARMAAHLREHPRAPVGKSLRDFADVTLRSIVERLFALEGLVENSAGPGVAARLAQEKPQLSGELRDTLRDAVATLERTKGAFKSKELGDLRRRLELLLDN